MLAWANVELELAQIFSLAVKSDILTIPDAMWSSIKSFDGKASMLHNVMRIRFEKNPVVSEDWNLLHEHVRKMSRWRNKIVHATMLSDEGKKMMLEPFFIMTQPGPHLSVDDVKLKTVDFQGLYAALMWFFGNAFAPPPKEIASKFPTPIPDLVLRLRSEAAKRRDEQQGRPK